MHTRKSVPIFWLIFAGAPLALAQTGPRPRIQQAVDNRRVVTLRGNIHPLARPGFDRGAAEPDLPMERMLLVLRRGADQEAALEGLLDEQQDPSSPNFRHWLTPEEFGAQFGAAGEDIETVRAWLLAQGFQVNGVARGRVAIEFTGTAGQVEQAFHAPIHKFAVNGEEHWANQTDPQIPAALEPVIAGVATLHNFQKRTHMALTQPLTDFSGGTHALAPADFAVIYNVNPAYQSGINGAGVTIAVVGRSDINVQDVLDFRSFFGLPDNPPQMILNGPDPGIVSTAEASEAVLDTTWSGAVAPNATVKLVISKSTNTSDGADLSELYAIDNNVGGILTESFGACEAETTAAEASLISALAQQAAAEGITYMVSTGDSGSSGCANPNTQSVASGPLAVNVLAATPYAVAVGGTQLNDASGSYWSAENGANSVSALSYIPENVWNESCAAGQTDCTKANIWAGGGGASIFFTKPVWQAGVAGIPADGHRDVPDVSLAAAGHNPYLLCLDGSCHGASKSFWGVSGTSASAPAFAGIMALVDQRMQARQGQANYTLYRMAAREDLSQCNGSSTSGLPAGPCVFHDVTAGSNSVPGGAGYGTSSGEYPAGTGYDAATGLGSVDVANLINSWSSAGFSASVSTLASGTVVANIAVELGAERNGQIPEKDVSRR